MLGRGVGVPCLSTNGRAFRELPGLSVMRFLMEVSGASGVLTVGRVSTVSTASSHSTVSTVSEVSTASSVCSI